MTKYKELNKNQLLDEVEKINIKVPRSTQKAVLLKILTITVKEVKDLMRANNLSGISKVNSSNKHEYYNNARLAVKAVQRKKLPRSMKAKDLEKKCGNRVDDNPWVTGSKALDEIIINSLIKLEREVRQDKDPSVEDLCKTPAGLYFCRENLGIVRSKMPQLQGEVFRRYSDVRKFLDTLINRDVKIEEDLIEVCKIRPTQSELLTKKVLEKLETLERARGDLEAKKHGGRLTKKFFAFLMEMLQPIIISKDYYILDGHHRWAALLSWDFIDKVDKPIKIHVKKIDLPMADLYVLATKDIALKRYVKFA
jgi:hypothetical protein